MLSVVSFSTGAAVFLGDSVLQRPNTFQIEVCVLVRLVSEHSCVQLGGFAYVTSLYALKRHVLSNSMFKYLELVCLVYTCSSCKCMTQAGKLIQNIGRN